MGSMVPGHVYLHTNKREREKKHPFWQSQHVANGAPFFRRKERPNKKKRTRSTTATVSPSFSFLLSLSLSVSPTRARRGPLRARHFQNLRRPFDRERQKRALTFSIHHHRTKGRKEERKKGIEKRKRASSWSSSSFTSSSSSSTFFGIVEVVVMMMSSSRASSFEEHFLHTKKHTHACLGFYCLGFV